MLVCICSTTVTGSLHLRDLSVLSALIESILSCELQVSEYQGNRQVTLSCTGYTDQHTAAVCLKSALTATIKQPSSTCIYMQGQ